MRIILLYWRGNRIYEKSEDTIVMLDNNAASFTKVEQDLDFRDMEPGEDRTAVISFVNNSDREMNFSRVI